MVFLEYSLSYSLLGNNSNPDTDQFWLIDYRMYDPDGDGKSKLDHVREMLTHIVYQKALPFQAVLMDTWYATKELMLWIEMFKKFSYCPLKDNRRVLSRPSTRSSALLAQACQQLWLVAHHDVYRAFTSVHHTIHPAPSPPDAGRYTVPSRFRCQSGDCGYHVRRLCTGCYLPAHPRRILLMEQQVWAVQHARQSTLRPRVAVPFQKVMHRGWAYFQARLAFTMAAFNVLVQWHGFQPNASGFVPLSMAEFSL